MVGGVSHAKGTSFCPSIGSRSKAEPSGSHITKGSEFRKWYGNNDCVYQLEKRRRRCQSLPGIGNWNPQSFAQPTVSPGRRYPAAPSRSALQTGGPRFRRRRNSIFAGEAKLKYLRRRATSSVILRIAGMLSPTLNSRWARSPPTRSCLMSAGDRTFATSSPKSATSPV